MNNSSRPKYPPISDYGYISDCHSSALISRAGSIDWCCMPRIDSASCFGRLLDWKNGGYCKISPVEDCQVSRRYIERTLVLESSFLSEKGEVRMLDFFAMRKGGAHKPLQQILRILEGVRGELEISLECAPLFDYGAVRPWIRQKGDHFLAIGGQTGLLLSGLDCLRLEGRHKIRGTLQVKKGERHRFSILYGQPENLEEGLVIPPSNEAMDSRLDQTINWWRRWADQGTFSGSEREMVIRSAIVLKGLSNAPTGAIAAAATTSLPEAPGGSRNWDYRFSWIRDCTQ